MISHTYFRKLIQTVLQSVFFIAFQLHICKSIYKLKLHSTYSHVTTKNWQCRSWDHDQSDAVRIFLYAILLLLSHPTEFQVWECNTYKAPTTVQIPHEVLSPFCWPSSSSKWKSCQWVFASKMWIPTFTHISQRLYLEA